MSNSSIGGGGLSSPVGETDGGTGQTSYTTGDILYSDATNSLAKLPAGGMPGGQLIIGFDDVVQWFNPLTHVILYDDFLKSGAAGWTVTQAGGAVVRNANQSADDTYIGNITGSAPVVGGIVTIRGMPFNNWGGYIFGGGRAYFHWIFRLDDLSDGTDTLEIYLGFGTGQGGAPSNGIYFSYTDTGATPNWQINCDDAAITTADSGIAADTNPHVFAVEVNADATSVSFYIDGVETSNSPITTNITADGIGPYFSFEKTAGTNAQEFLMDQIYYYQELTTSR